MVPILLLVIALVLFLLCAFNVPIPKVHGPEALALAFLTAALLWPLAAKLSGG